METKLKDITTEYSKFNTNQVLTAKQLNAFIDYFDDQDRLSRIALNGIGIACGFQLTPEYNADNSAIQSLIISQGVGVTTDGDLVQFHDLLEKNLKSKKFRFYRKFEDDKAKYPKFLSSQSNQYDLWEVFTDNDGTYSNLVELSDIKKMAAILYLEQYPNEDALCNKLNCDNQGIEQINNLRVLLISYEVLEAIATKDDIFTQHDWFKINDTLPVVEARRVVLNEDNTETFSSLKGLYNTAVKDESIATDLILGYEVILNKFGLPTITNKIKSLFSFSALNIPLDFQYRYDTLKDLIDTYNEIKQLLLHINVNCCPNIGAFPKHLMLGKIEKSEFPELRHRFYNSPIISNEDENLSKIHILLQRAISIATNYIGTSKTDDIEVTPSMAHASLSEKAVPFYYNVNNELLKNWNYNKTVNYKSDENLSYHKDNLDKSLPIQRPLHYNIDKNDFYRIEGHQGKMYGEALAKIQKLKKDHGLSFDVKTLSINATSQTININDYECEFEDLKMLLNAWKAEQNCILSEVSKTFSAFKFTDPKVNVVADKYKTVKDAINDGIIGAVDDLAAREFSTKSVIENKEFTFKEEVVYGKSDVLFQDQRELHKSYERNIIEDNLTKEDETLGFIIGNFLDKNKGGSSSDIIVELEKEIAPIRDKDVWIQEPELSDFILTDITETLVHAYVLDNKVPLNIRDINDTILVSYKLTIEKLCQQVKKLQAKYNVTNLADSTKQILGLMINQLSIVCCSGKKLETLLAEIENRKEKILDKIQLSEFVKHHPGLEHKAGVIPGGTFVMVYVTENATDANTFNNVVLDIIFREQPTDRKSIEDSIFDSVRDDVFSDKDELLTKDALISYKNGGLISLWDKSSTINFSFVDAKYPEFTKRLFLDDDVVLVGKTLGDTVVNFTAFLNRTWSRAGLGNIISAEETLMYKDGSVGMRITIKDRLIPKDEFYFQIYNPNVLGTNKRLYFDDNEVIRKNETLRNTVVADFSLPYMCCSDCAPVNFIVPKEPVFLSLPVSYICLDNSTSIEPLVFNKLPIDGVIGSDIPEDFESGIFVDPTDNKTKLDVTKIDKNYLGKTINFTVNGEPTDCQIIVYPDVNLSVVVEPISYNEDKTEATVAFSLKWDDDTLITSDFINQVKFNWDFIGNGLQKEQTPVDNQFTHLYTLPVNELNIITPTLQVSLGPCTKSIIIEPIIFDSETPSELSIVPSYCLNSETTSNARIPFINVGGAITINGVPIPGVSIEGSELVINAAEFNAYDQLIRFNEDGQTTNARIVIYEVQQIQIIEGKNSGFVWEDEKLVYRADFSVELPNGTDANSLNIKWEAEGQTSNAEMFTPNFVIEPDSVNTIKVNVTVEGKTGCTSEDTKDITISYPDFIIDIPDATFCLEDKNPHVISIKPVVQGSVLKANGLKFNEERGVWEFIPAAAGLSSAGTITVSLVGTNVTGIIQVTERSKASFTHSFNSETRVLSLTNTSEIGNQYIWSINGIERQPQTTRRTITVDLSDFTGSSVRVSLSVQSHCGTNTITEVVEIPTIITKTCEEEMQQILLEEQKLFLAEDKELATEFVETIINPTINLYNGVLKNFTNYSSGENNATIEKPFSTLLNNTAEAIKKDPENETLKKYYRAQVKIYFAIIHCQTPETLETKGDNGNIITFQISRVLNEIDTDLIEFQKRRIKIDIKTDSGGGNLQTFLELCAETINSKLIAEVIQLQLVETLKNSI
ncbi:hypothetical protein BTO06_18090 [Tenacibaculum sp. SZ-18]|uniref:hypothetical protein n=1 Tax=Tenacibaculum sp. SZ-18 TaxID=754423 RepID=UPI000C2D6466|nr:hypothetical protein [Tenacibaculum sp. SZ-18]AUC16941.1 hypothetical protein BTO06_18090 [Tenacibaculum sp. SZ-18]